MKLEEALKGAVEFALKELHKSELALTSQQKETLWNVVIGKDTFASLEQVMEISSYFLLAVIIWKDVPYHLLLW